MTAGEVLEADWTWTGTQFERGIRIGVGADGRITEVGALPAPPTGRLTDRALLPGFVNAHSHAFQRGLRGVGERFPKGKGSFWSWREAMYDLVARLDAATFGSLTAQAFREMLGAGITGVGEFHYLHHSPAAADWAFDRMVLNAAAEAGIRITLLLAYYRTGGIDRPLESGQRRFATASVAEYFEHLDALREEIDPNTQQLGVVAHSIRAAEPDEIAALYGGARERGLSFHMHVEEQRREIEECQAAYGCTPMAAILDATGSADGFTAVHCTHTSPGDMERFLDRGGRVCVCPLTEANLGDGLATLSTEHVERARLALGTDSNARIDFLEEARWLEYGQRVRSEERGILRDHDGAVAPALLRTATEGGAAALGMAAGRLVAGGWADFTLIDVRHPALAGIDGAHLADAIVVGTGSEALVGTAVGGQWRDTALHRNTPG